MHRQAVHALAHPVFNPETQIKGHHWEIGRITAGLTVNIGME